MTTFSKFLLSIIVFASCAAVAFGIYKCDSDVPVYRTDYRIAEDLFLKCLEKLPEGPVQTKYNDWDETVAECQQASIILSQRCIKNCRGIYDNSK